MLLEKSDNQAEAMTSSVVLREASDLLRQLAGESRPGESVKSIFWRLSRHQLKKWKPSRIRSIWYEDPRAKVRAEELAQLRALAGPERASPNELEELRTTVARLARYEGLLERIDAEFFGPQVSATRDQAGQARGLLGKSRI